jgi:hypothetical protein
MDSVPGSFGMTTTAVLESIASNRGANPADATPDTAAAGSFSITRVAGSCSSANRPAIPVRYPSSDVAFSTAGSARRRAASQSRSEVAIAGCTYFTYPHTLARPTRCVIEIDRAHPRADGRQRT